MLIPSSQISGWKDLQDKVAQLFKEMGYDVQSPHIVKHVRGEKEIDVYVSDPRTSVPHVILIECKHWGSNLPQDTVHGFRTVMTDTGANTGIIVGTTGFQSGAKEAVNLTNVELRTWDSLQRAYGNEWFLRQQERIAPLEEEIRRRDRDYLDQGQAIKTAANLMRFEHTGRLVELYDLLAEGRLLIFAMMSGPKSFDQPGPIEVSVDEEYTGAERSRNDLFLLRLKDVRAWFQWVEGASRSLIERFRVLEKATFDTFEALPDAAADESMKRTFRGIREETPIRVLKSRLQPDEYERLLELVSGSDPPIGDRP